MKANRGMTNPSVTLPMPREHELPARLARPLMIRGRTVPAWRTAWRTSVWRTAWPTAWFVPLALLATTSRAQAYPEFQRGIQADSGRVVSCAMCHTHPDGPDGVKHGQIGSLGQGEMQSLSRSRGMLEPGPAVDSPILNPFGDYLVAHLGRKRLMAYKTQPAVLIAAMDQKHDLDRDGIADARELRDGTDPTDVRHGDPGLLFLENVRRHWFHLAMLAAATLLGLHGLNRLFRWFAYETQRAVESKTETRRPLPPDR